jgi:outer membrane protein assembly factor BamB
MRLTSRLAILAGSFALAAPLGLAATVAPAGVAGAPSEWPQYGQSPRHLNTNPAEKTFTPGNVSGLHTLFTAGFGSNTLTEGGPAVANGMMYIGGFDGNLNAYRASGWGKPTCRPAWRGVAGNDFTSTAAVAGGLVFIGSADHVLYAFPAAGCGAAVCAPRTYQNYLGAPLAVAEGKVFMASTDNISGRTLVYAMGLPG